MNPKISMLSAEAKSEIHARSLEILEKVGIRFHSRKVCQILQEAGCEVDWDKLSARIPRSLVEAGLATPIDGGLSAGVSLGVIGPLATHLGADG